MPDTPALIPSLLAHQGHPIQDLEQCLTGAIHALNQIENVRLLMVQRLPNLVEIRAEIEAISREVEGVLGTQGSHYPESQKMILRGVRDHLRTVVKKLPWKEP